MSETSLIRPETNNSHNSYWQILRSTTIVGGAEIVNMALRIVRTKCLAVLLGPAGVGLMGTYDSITSIAILIAGMGIETSAVRQTAEAAATNDQKKIARTIIALRRVVVCLGAVGMGTLILLSTPLSFMTFGKADYSGDITLLSVVIFLGAVLGGQRALLMGMHRIWDLAKLSVFGALSGTMLSISIIYVWGQKG